MSIQTEFAEEEKRRVRRAHIVAGMLEAVAMATMSGVFFTLLVKQLGVSDALAGTLSTVVHLGCVTQIFAIGFLRRIRSVRTTSIILQSIKKLLYAFLYMLPFLPMATGVRIALFAVVFAGASISSNLISPASFHWMMAFVSKEERGIYTAHREMLTLIVTIVYNFLMGRVLDHFNAQGRPEIGLVLCACTILVMMFAHIIAMLFTKDSPAVLEQIGQTPNFVRVLKNNLHNTNLLKLVLVGVTWNFFCFFSTSFHNVFLLQELQSTTTFVVVAGMFGNFIRLACSAPSGKYADHNGFARSMGLGFALAALAIGLMMFWTPETGRLYYLLYQIPYCSALALLGNGQNNITLQYIDPADRVGAQGMYTAMLGLSSFLGSLVGGRILAAIQANGNRVFGIPMYGQQFLSGISFIALVALTVYVYTVVARMKRID
ncbi:MAG: MFS transporter [Oscillospiraceae bacterium]|nr:MFS transporter [Oscillospiraceae bacterium]